MLGVRSVTSPLNASYQVGIGTLAVGSGTTVATPVSVLSISGLGSSVRSHDAEYDLDDGAVAGTDTAGVRVLNIVFEIFSPGDPETAMDWHQSIADAFAASNTTQTLYVWMPGTGHVSFSGRTRGMDDDGLADMPLGLIQVTARFDALDPTMTAVTP